MVGASVLNQPLQFSIPQLNHAKNLEIDCSVKEKECISMIKKCKNLREFKQVHSQILKLGLFWSSFCASNLLSTCALSEWGSMDYACSIFQLMDDPGSFDFNIMVRGYIKDMKFEESLFTYIEMLDREVKPDNFTYPAILKACGGLSALDEGMQIHGHILKLGFVEGVFVQNSLIHFYGKCRELKLSHDVFKKMDQKTIASWSALIAAHANSGMWDDCLRLFLEMNDVGIWKAEESTVVSVLSACSHLRALDLGRSVHGYLVRNLTGLNIAVETSLIDMYVRCGILDKGLRLFRKMREKNEKSYSVVISGLANHGRGEEALDVFERMLEEGLKPDDVVYVGVLSACSHSGLVEEGSKYFETMQDFHGIKPRIEHYGCLVHLLGRAGMIDEALEVIKSMDMEPNDVIWRNLLSSCRIHHQVEIGELAGQNLFRLKAQNASDYLMMSNIYAKAQRWNDVAKIRTEMVEKGIGQVAGSSLVEVKRKVYKFVSNDKSHHRWCREIYEMLHQMEWQLKFEGYCPDTSQVLFDVDEEEKRQRLSSHSQKLAIAFSLIHTVQGSPIRIVRNVRMCSDCHTYTKLISVIYERQIIVRDRNIFHYFKDGTCSCKDYW